MQYFLTICCLLFASLLSVQTQVLYQCNFDAGASANCFTPASLIGSGSATAITSTAPNAPLSDVTSSLKPTTNGEVCKLPYRLGTYTWDSYFCSKGFCPTTSGRNSSCTPGQFGYFTLNNNVSKTSQLTVPASGINGIDEQCLTYYYHASNTTQRLITVRKQESNGDSEVIDTVTNLPFNGWIRRSVSYIAKATGYKIYFDVQRTSGSVSATISFDEISISQGSCDSQPVTGGSTTSTSTATLASTTTTITTTVSTTTSTVTTSTPIPILSTTTEGVTTTTSIPTTTTISTATTTTPQSTTTTITDVSTTTSIPTTMTATSSATTTITEAITTTSIPIPITTTITDIPTSVTTTPIPLTTSISTISSTSSTTSVTTETTTTTEQIETSSAASSTTITGISETTSTTSITTSTSTVSSTETTTSVPVTFSTTDFSTTTTTLSSTSTRIEGTTTTTASEDTPTVSTSSTTSTTYSVSSTTTVPVVISTSTSSKTSTRTTTSTATNAGNVILSEYSESVPRESSHVVAMAVVIPLVWIAFIGVLVWIKKSTGALGQIRYPLNNGLRETASSGTYELNAVSDA